MKVFIDTDILLDVGLKREPFYKDSSKIIDFAENKTIHGYIAWHSLSNFYYLTSNQNDKTSTIDFLADLLEFIKVAPTGTEAAKKALVLEVGDFEDALQISAAITAGVEFIITRNTKHYRKSPVKALSPKKFLQEIFA